VLKCDRRNSAQRRNRSLPTATYREDGSAPAKRLRASPGRRRNIKKFSFSRDQFSRKFRFSK
jgi:hypothetical protein